MLIEARIQDKFQIEPHTWQHLKGLYWKVVISPFAYSAFFTLIIWGVLTFGDSDFFWLPYLLTPWMFVFFASIIFYRQFFIRSKITVIFKASFFFTFQFTLFLCFAAGTLELFGHFGMYLNILLLMATVYFFYKWMQHWNILWESNQFYNENTAIDPENARFEIMNGFKYDDKKARRQGYKPFIGNWTSRIGLILFPAIFLINAGAGYFLGYAFVYSTLLFFVVFFTWHLLTPPRIYYIHMEKSFILKKPSEGQ